MDPNTGALLAQWVVYQFRVSTNPVCLPIPLTIHPFKDIIHCVLQGGPGLPAVGFERNGVFFT